MKVKEKVRSSAAGVFARERGARDGAAHRAEAVARHPKNRNSVSRTLFSSLFPGPHIKREVAARHSGYFHILGPFHVFFPLTRTDNSIGACCIRLSRCLQRAHEIAENTEKTRFPEKSADERTYA